MIGRRWPHLPSRRITWHRACSVDSCLTFSFRKRSVYEPDESSGGYVHFRLSLIPCWVGNHKLFVKVVSGSDVIRLFLNRHHPSLICWNDQLFVPYSSSCIHWVDRLLSLPQLWSRFQVGVNLELPSSQTSGCFPLPQKWIVLPFFGWRLTFEWRLFGPPHKRPIRYRWS